MWLELCPFLPSLEKVTPTFARIINYDPFIYTPDIFSLAPLLISRTHNVHNQVAPVDQTTCV